MKANLLSRLDAAHQRLTAISGSLPHVDDRQYNNELPLEMLRETGYDLVSLAGELTTLGVDMARLAIELTHISNDR